MLKCVELNCGILIFTFNNCLQQRFAIMKKWQDLILKNKEDLAILMNAEMVNFKTVSI